MSTNALTPYSSLFSDLAGIVDRGVTSFAYARDTIRAKDRIASETIGPIPVSSLYGTYNPYGYGQGGYIPPMTTPASDNSLSPVAIVGMAVVAVAILLMLED